MGADNLQKKYVNQLLILRYPECAGAEICQVIVGALAQGL
jgi:hypothetical protein